MNKGVIIGIIAAVVIVAGAIVLGQENEFDTTMIIEDGQTEPKNFSIDLQESVGMTEKP